jgi:hypothetical protein
MMLYVYALTDAAARGARAESIDLGGIYAATAKVRKAPEISESALRRHDRAVREIAAGAPAILPMRFGAVVADAGELARLVAPKKKELERALARVRGCVQMTVRVFGGPPVRERAPLARKPSRGAGSGARYLAERRAALRRAAKAPEIESVLRALARFVRAERVERHDAAPLVASVYHLVRSEDAAAYEAAFDAAAPSALPVRALRSGPWPPYAFAAEVLA